jgi:hypothetical protein
LTIPVLVRALSPLLLALVLAGCGFGGETTQEAVVGDGLTRYEISSGDFAIGVPETWHATSATSMRKANFKRFASQNPAFAAYAEALGKKNSPFKFFAYDSVVHNHFSTNLNVLVQPVPRGTTWERYKASALREARSVADSKVKAGEVALPAGKAVKARYTVRFTLNGRKKAVSTTQYALLLDGKSYVLTYTSLPADRAEYAIWFEQSAKSFQLTTL